MLVVKKCKYGRGVFTTKDLRAGRVIIVNHLLLLTADDRADSLLLRRYDFGFESNGSGIALGIASLMNHSTRPNADFDTEYNSDGLPIVFVRTIKPIKKGSQILVDYGYNPEEIE